MLHMVGRTDRHFVGKSCAQNDESGSGANGSKVSKNSVRLSNVPEDSGETIVETPKVKGVPVPSRSEDEGITGSPAIYGLFRKWLNTLHTHSTSEVDEILKGPPGSEELPQTQNDMLNKERSEILKAIWWYSLNPDAMIKTMLLLFIPLYLAVSALCGAEVSKEPTPLWMLGPLVVAFYVEVLPGLWTLYVFTFSQTVKVIVDFPT